METALALGGVLVGSLLAYAGILVGSLIWMGISEVIWRKTGKSVYELWRDRRRWHA